MKNLMEGFQDRLSLYHCIRIVYDPSKERDDDMFFVCDTRIACFSSPEGIHSFKHSMGKESMPTVWTAPMWDHNDISKYNEDRANQKLLEPDDSSVDTFYIICKNSPWANDKEFMDHVEITVKSSLVAAKFTKDAQYIRRDKGKLKSKSMVMSACVDDGSAKKYLIDIILPYICNLCKDPGSGVGPDKTGQENTAFTYVSEASVL